MGVGVNTIQRAVRATLRPQGPGAVLGTSYAQFHSSITTFWGALSPIWHTQKIRGFRCLKTTLSVSGRAAFKPEAWAPRPKKYSCNFLMVTRFGSCERCVHLRSALRRSSGAALEKAPFSPTRCPTPTLQWQRRIKLHSLLAVFYSGTQENPNIPELRIISPKQDQDSWEPSPMFGWTKYTPDKARGQEQWMTTLTSLNQRWRKPTLCPTLSRPHDKANHLEKQ